MGVAQFNAFSAIPTALVLSGEGDVQPVRLYYGELRLKKGGKVDKAAAMKKAGRNGDTEMIHVNKEELAELTKMWGPPSVNPETGLPEFFLKKVWKKVKKIAKPLASIAQIALPFIPGVGPIASMALGAGLGGITGGLKGALGGAATGAIGGGLAGKMGTKIGIGKMGGNVLAGALGGAGGGVKGIASGALTGGIAGGLGEQLAGKLPGNMDPRLKTALANGLLGGAAAGVGGGDPMMGALGTGMASYLTKQGRYGQTAPRTGDAALGVPPSDTGVQVSQSALDKQIIKSMDPYGINPEPVQLIPGLGLQGLQSAPSTSFANLSPELQKAFSTPLSFQPQELAVQSPNLGLDKPTAAQMSMAAVPAAAAGIGATAAAKKKKKADPWANLMTDPNSYLPATFNAKLPDPSGIYKNLGRRDLSNLTEEDWLNSGFQPERAYVNYATGYKRGGKIGNGEGSKAKRESFAVQGPGTGRSDDIPARLSDGEYVVDAETVALLGDGSSKAGAERLDQLRVNLRKHKGKHLAKGKFSVNAKKPEAYMRGGRV